jgi:hypothetical protein
MIRDVIAVFRLVPSGFVPRRALAADPGASREANQ